MDDLISRAAAIDTDGLDEEIRCEMCRNPIHTNRGCDGNCRYDEKLYKKIIQILDKRINPLPSAQPYTEAEIQKMQELEQAELDKAFECGRESAITDCGCAKQRSRKAGRMSRLIDADRLLSEKMKSKYYHLPNGDIAIPLIDIEHAPTIEERKTGRWIDAVLPNDNGGLPVQVCDQCNTFFPLAYTGGGHNFCPNCGAKMEG